MADDHATRDALAQLRADFEAQLAAQRDETTALRARLERPRRRLPRRVLPLALVALLVVLTPLSLLAASPFNDLTGGVHDANIGLIYDAGITKGCVPNVSYCPTANVTREEMASFLARTAGLGTNPPVVNAKTAQTAGSATNATHATSADTATNAINAQNAVTAQTATNATAVGGFAANDLARVAFVQTNSTEVAITTTAETDIASVTLTVTRPSYVLVEFTGYAFAVGTAGCPCSLVGRLYADGADQVFVQRVNLATAASTLVDGRDRQAFPGSAVFSLPAGTHTFTFRAIQLTGTSTKLGVTANSLHALAIPFGATGGGATALPDPAGGGSEDGR